MHFFEILLIAIGLSMDAFAVAVSKGLSMEKGYKNSLKIGLYFGFFQAFMPLIGYFLGLSFDHIVTKLDHYIAFTLLTIIGLSMILEKDEEDIDSKIDFKTMLLLSIATSIDALAVGVTFAFLNVNIILSILTIGIITFSLSFIGVLIGNKFGKFLKNKAQLFGGIILILTGIKILLEHLNVI